MARRGVSGARCGMRSSLESKRQRWQNSRVQLGYSSLVPPLCLGPVAPACFQPQGGNAAGTGRRNHTNLCRDPSPKRQKPWSVADFLLQCPACFPTVPSPHCILCNDRPHGREVLGMEISSCLDKQVTSSGERRPLKGRLHSPNCPVSSPTAYRLNIFRAGKTPQILGLRGNSLEEVQQERTQTSQRKA